MAEDKFKWYVMRAVSGKEAKVKEYIDAEIKNGQLGGFVQEVMIPTEKVYQMQGSKRVVKERNYLPGYVLVNAHLVGEIAHILRSTPNCLGFLGGTDNPEPLRPSEVNRIQGKEEEKDVEPIESFIPFEVNDSVKIKDGPFTGFSGTIQEVNAEKNRVTVSVMVFGRSQPVSLEYAQVEKE